MSSRHFSPTTILAATALFFALGGSALAVQQAVKPQGRCSTGAVRGIATVTGGSAGINAVGAAWSAQGVLFARRFNCGGAISVRRSETGVYDIRFAGNSSQTAIGGALDDGRSVTVTRNPDASFRVTIRGFVSPGNETTFGRIDSAFTVILL